MNPRLNAALTYKSKIWKNQGFQKMVFKKKRKMLQDTYRNVKIFSTQQEKIHNIWHPFKIPRHVKKQKYNPNEEKDQTIETNQEMTEIIIRRQRLKQLL